MRAHVIVLAAGEGKRMQSDLPKVAHEAAGRSLVEWVLASVEPMAPDSIVVVVGHGADQVRELLPDGVATAVQEQQLGTGHATACGLEALHGVAEEDVVVILYGDVPLLPDDLVGRLAALSPDEAGRMITARVDDPEGYGRVLRDDSGAVTGVVEQRDCSDEQKHISEINAGIYAIRAGLLEDALSHVTNENSQGEYYLTDVVGILASEGRKLTAVEAAPVDVMGINSQDQLAEAAKVLRQRINRRLMADGVWMLDPDRTYVDHGVTVEPGARLLPGVHLGGRTSVSAGARVGPDTFVLDSTIGEGATVWYSVLRSAQVGEGCEVGPFASLRPGTILRPGSKLGTFVEAKNVVLGELAKANHLAYLGDASIGARSNIGAGVVTVNYDGVRKSHTEIGEDAFVGSDTMLVAPVRVGDRASTGAGSVITSDVSDDALALERGDQKEIPGYAQRREARRAAKEAED